MAMPGWLVEEYERVRGDVPVQTFVANLDGQDANRAAALLLKLDLERVLTYQADVMRRGSRAP
jgi:hypothetical protein